MLQFVREAAFLEDHGEVVVRRVREVVAVDARFSHFIGGAGELRPEAGDDVSDLVRIEGLETSRSNEVI